MELFVGIIIALPFFVVWIGGMIFIAYKFRGGRR